MEKRVEILAKYLPSAAVNMVDELFDIYHFHFVIVSKRKTKHGDFRRLRNGDYQITINNDLNKYRFLLTLIHEMAHLLTFKEKPKSKPHGIEWKTNFQRLMLPFLQPDIYPHDILIHLAKYLKNPKASTDADIQLSLSLKKYDDEKEGSYIHEIPTNATFFYRNVAYQKGNKRRTRFECVELKSKKKYLFHHNALVKIQES
ncbi:SprT-like domain-containing protein [Namhaeicola litoreus]|uniref:SprT-like domain-containing protein n=1 Tax=Namhaeicola litoreus TaxID=1052145 RepID=A0ABW3Y2H4_9FLAO